MILLYWAYYILSLWIYSFIFLLDNFCPLPIRDSIAGVLENGPVNSSAKIGLWRQLMDFSTSNIGFVANNGTSISFYNRGQATERSINLKIYNEQGSYNPPVGVVIWLHGGGWVFGSINGYEETCATVSKLTGLLVVSVEYSLSPERSFPAPIEDIIQSLAWVQKHISLYGGDPNTIFIAGDSAGGNLAAAVMAALLDQTESAKLLSNPIPSEIFVKAVKGLLLIYPTVDNCLNRSCWDSYRLFEHDFILPLKRMIWFRQMYLDNYSLPNSADYIFAPIYTPPNILASFPKTILLIAGRDILRDEGLSFATKLEESGVTVVKRVFNGAIHGFFQMEDFYGSKRTAMLFAAEQLRQIVHSLASDVCNN